MMAELESGTPFQGLTPSSSVQHPCPDPWCALGEVDLDTPELLKAVSVQELSGPGHVCHVCHACHACCQAHCMCAVEGTSQPLSSLIQVHMLPLSAPDELKAKAKYQTLFDLVYISNRQGHRLCLSYSNALTAMSLQRCATPGRRHWPLPCSRGKGRVRNSKASARAQARTEDGVFGHGASTVTCVSAAELMARVCSCWQRQTRPVTGKEHACMHFHFTLTCGVGPCRDSSPPSPSAEYFVFSKEPL